MTEEAFRAKRRQPFLTERYFELNEIDIARSIRNNETVIAEERDTGKCDSSSYGSRFKNTLKLLRLHYTAGESIETLKSPYADTMKWFTEWHRAEEEYSRYLAMKSGKDLRLDMTPLHFEDLCHFQLALDVVSVGVLLGEGDAVRQAAKLMDSSRGSDMLFEAIIESAVTDPRDVDEFFHVKPYDPLLDAIYTAETPEQASAFVKIYLEGWYKSFEGVPWHDGHTVVTDEYMAYEGYWAFEAAAVCVLYGIDDSSFRDHIVYPKDLADWARAHEVVNRIKPDAPGAATTPATANRCGAGQPCPREGWWFTPAKQDSRRHFQQGEVMPDMHADSWATIWQWDEHNQQD